MDLKKMAASANHDDPVRKSGERERNQQTLHQLGDQSKTSSPKPMSALEEIERTGAPRQRINRKRPASIPGGVRQL
jgi:hypothetical protein